MFLPHAICPLLRRCFAMSVPGESCVVGPKGTSPAEVLGAKGISLEVGDESAAVGDEHGLRSWSALKSLIK